ncbi:hypothetical protein D3C74_367620 [compost metagenome]
MIRLDRRFRLIGNLTYRLVWGYSDFFACFVRSPRIRSFRFYGFTGTFGRLEIVRRANLILKPYVGVRFLRVIHKGLRSRAKARNGFLVRPRVGLLKCRNVLGPGKNLLRLVRTSFLCIQHIIWKRLPRSKLRHMRNL